MAQILFHCALRVSELGSLNTNQVDGDNRLLLSVRAKGDKQFAAVFNDVLSEALERPLTQVFSTQRVESKGDISLFFSDSGRRISVRTVQDMIRRYAELAGISR